MTTTQIRKEIHKAGKEVSHAQLYRYLAELRVSPAGARQRPQRYPEDTAERILKHLGFSSGGRGLATSSPTVQTGAKRAAGIITLKQLKKHQPRRGK